MVARAPLAAGTWLKGLMAQDPLSAPAVSSTSEAINEFDPVIGTGDDKPIGPAVVPWLALKRSHGGRPSWRDERMARCLRLTNSAPDGLDRVMAEDG